MKAQALGLALIIVGHGWIPRAWGRRGFVFLQPLRSFLSHLFGLPLLSRALFLSFGER